MPVYFSDRDHDNGAPEEGSITLVGYRKAYYPFGANNRVGGMVIAYYVAEFSDCDFYVITPDWAGDTAMSIQCGTYEDARDVAEQLAMDMLSITRDWDDSGNPNKYGEIDTAPLAFDGRVLDLEEV